MRAVSRADELHALAHHTRPRGWPPPEECQGVPVAAPGRVEAPPDPTRYMTSLGSGGASLDRQREGAGHPGPVAGDVPAPAGGGEGRRHAGGRSPPPLHPPVTAR